MSKSKELKQKRLSLYRIDIKYIRNLAHADDNVLSVSPQINKSERPFVGIIVICDSKQYCVPLSSPKEKHLTKNNDVDFTRVYDGDRLIAVLNFNNMIPVDDGVIQPLSIRPSYSDDPKTRHYKKMASKQLTFCQRNQEAIIRKANKLYQLIATDKASHHLRQRCCDFKKLEKVLEKWNSNR